MNDDALTMAALRDELAELLLGGRVQRIVRPSDLAVGLEIYAGQRHQVLFSADPQAAGIRLGEAKLRRGSETASPLQLLLRKYVDGTRLAAVEQPELERVLRLRFVGPEGAIELVCEIMGRLSNIILVDADGLVMDAVKRVPGSINRYRTVLPRHPYVPPPPQDKENPLLLTAARLEELCSQAVGTPLWRRLVDAARGISPLLAREIVYRALGTLDPEDEPGAAEYAALAAAVDELLHLPQTHAWAPSVGYEGEDDERAAVAYAPYELTHYPDHEAVTTISEAIARVEGVRAAGDPYRQARRRLNDLVAEGLGRQEARHASLTRSLAPAVDLDRLQWSGNAILALGWSLAPGQKELLVEPGTFEGVDEALAIEIDPALSPSENANRYFREYQRVKAATEQVPALLAETEAELAFLRQLQTEASLAEDRAQFDEVEEELRAAGYGRGRQAARKGGGRAARSAPLAVRAPDEMPIWVGRNSRQNEELTFRRAAPDDMWLHAHGVPGAHVIVRCGGAPVAEETLLLAARLAAHYSSARAEPRVQVDFTARRHVHHMPGGRPGMVIYTHESTLVVAPGDLEPPDEDA